ncbi:hypothetical protein [Bosea sp. 2RAB26]
MRDQQPNFSAIRAFKTDLVSDRIRVKRQQIRQKRAMYDAI